MIEKSHPSIRIYIWIFIALTILTGVTVAVSYLHLPISQAVALAVIVAAFKASLVAAFFMHLRFERKLIFWVLLATVFTMLILFIIPITSFQGFEPSSFMEHTTPSDTHDH